MREPVNVQTSSRRLGAWWSLEYFIIESNCVPRTLAKFATRTRTPQPHRLARGRVVLKTTSGPSLSRVVALIDMDCFCAPPHTGGAQLCIRGHHTKLESANAVLVARASSDSARAPSIYSFGASKPENVSASAVDL
eukprot:scaffold25569_cov61-Phaeocystis_antarctica.AAC.2